MKVSIIIPVYKVSKFIEKSINCICKQTMQEGVECIIVNDCTPDDSIVKAKQIIDAYNGSIIFKVIEHEKNRGLAAARSTGMKHATGDYVLHLDSDDFYEYNMVEELYNNAIENDADVAMCDIFNTYINNEYVYTINTLNSPEEYVLALINREYNTFLWNIWNKMIKREIFINNQITWTEGIDNGEDLLICTKLFCFVRNVSKVNKALYHYTHYNTTSFLNTTDLIENELLIIEEIEKFFREKNIYNTYIEDIGFRKLSTKLILLGKHKGYLNHVYHKLFPEAMKYVYKHPNISLLSKIKLYISYICPKFYILLYKFIR